MTRKTGQQGKPPTCPYCGMKTVLVPSTAHMFRGIERGPHWVCQCGARVGCHPGSTVALGVPADAFLRRARAQAHAMFDPIWRDICKQYRSRSFRVTAYRWLAKELGIAYPDCHIGKMTLDQCKAVVAICQDPERVRALRARFPHSNVISRDEDPDWKPAKKKEKGARQRRLRARKR